MGETSLPPNGFIGLLTGSDPFGYHFRRLTINATCRVGLFPLIDDDRLTRTLECWIEAVVSWFGELEATEFQDESHIKMAGALLWAIIQEECCPVDSVVQLRSEHHDEIRRLGLTSNIREFKKDRGKLYIARANASLGYVFTTAIFNSIQRARGITRAGIDFDDPPFTTHYFQNLCRYLATQSPTKVDLYMIFKTMDLYALDHPVHGG